MKGAKHWAEVFLAADLDYRALYRILIYHKPGSVCLADWRCTKEYKTLLKRMGEPIRRRRRQAWKMLGEVSK